MHFVCGHLNYSDIDQFDDFLHRYKSMLRFAVEIHRLGVLPIPNLIYDTLSSHATKAISLLEAYGVSDKPSSSSSSLSPSSSSLVSTPSSIAAQTENTSVLTPLCGALLVHLETVVRYVFPFFYFLSFHHRLFSRCNFLSLLSSLFLSDYLLSVTCYPISLFLLF